MILAALAAAAALPVTPPPIAERTPNLYREPPSCRDAPYRVVDRYGRPLPQKLGDLPRGAVILAVERTIGGCQVVTVAYGFVDPDQPNPPPTSYRADPLERSAPKREDAPSNRR
jgi:hypothetical protein